MRCDGAEVARLRRELGITQLDLADKAKVSKTTIERIERGIAVDYQSIHQWRQFSASVSNSLIRPEGGDTAGPEAAFVPLRSLGSAREWVDLLLRCDTAAVDLVDDPAEDATLAVIAVLQKLEACFREIRTPNGTRCEAGGPSAAERLRGVARVNNVLAELAAMGLHLLIGEVCGPPRRRRSRGCGSRTTSTNLKLPISPAFPASQPTTASVSPCCVWRSVAAPR